MKIRLQRYVCDLCEATTSLHAYAAQARREAQRAGWHLPGPDRGRWVICAACLNPNDAPADITTHEMPDQEGPS